MMASPVLEVSGLDVSLFTRAGAWPAIEGFGLTVHAGETVALVGESGCGKTLAALAIMRLLPDPPARITAGRVLLDGRDVVKLPERRMRRVRGREAAMIFQDPMTALNPVTSVGAQLVEAVRAHQTIGLGAARDRAVSLLERVGVTGARARLDDFPHQLSGGICQRVVIAMAIACNPRLLIADEATTALDVTIQAQVLALLKQLQRDAGLGMLFITHDLGVVAEIADRVAVMYAGVKVEEAPVDALFASAAHPYTRGLLAATPAPDAALRARLTEIPGRVPPLGERLACCPFADRCPLVFDHCRRARPALVELAPGHAAACFATAPA